MPKALIATHIRQLNSSRVGYRKVFSKDVYTVYRLYIYAWITMNDGYRLQRSSVQTGQ